MNKPFTFTLMEHLEERCKEMGIIVPYLEWLNPDGYSVSIVQNDAPSVEKSYINGSRQYRTQIEVLAQGTADRRLAILEDLQTFMQILNGMAGLDIGDGVKVLKVELTTPSLREQTESLIIRYGFSATIVYKD